MEDLFEFAREKSVSQQLHSEDIQNEFRRVLKSGIYKELHKRNLLSDAQLNSLIYEK